MKRYKKSKKKIKKQKTSTDKIIYRHTNADINKLISNVQTALSNTAKNFQNIVENISSFYHSLDRQASQLFSKKTHVQKCLIKNDIEIIIGRCNTLLKDKHAVVHIEKILSFFTNILKRMIDIQNKAKYREAYINTQQYPQLCKYYSDILEIVDSKATEFTKLVILKENNFNNRTKKMEENKGDNFQFDLEKKRVSIKFKENDQERFIKDKFITKLFMIDKQIEFTNIIKKYLEELNKNIKENTNFAKWFAGDIVLNIKKKFLTIKDLYSRLAHQMHPNMGNTFSDYLGNVFLSQDKIKDSELIVEWPEKENFNDFNEMLRGFYGQVFFLDYTIDHEYNKHMDMNPSINNQQQTKLVYPTMIYPTCYTWGCNFSSLNDLYHQHRIINVLGKEELRKQLPSLVKFFLKIGEFYSLDMAIILMLQCFRERLNFRNGYFDLKPLEEEIQTLNLEKNEIEKLKKHEYSVPFDLYVGHDKSMAEILAYSNVDRNMMKNSNTLITIMGSSGSGKTFTLNGDNKENKGLYELMTSGDSSKLEPAIFEYYHVAMPFTESFVDSTNEKLTCPRIWRFSIDQSNVKSIKCDALKTFEFGTKVSIQTYNNNYSKEGGIRETIENIRKSDNASDSRPYSTIRYTPNNPESSRSTYIQAIKINDNYHLVLDRPGEEDPYSTFGITNQYEMACYSNPIYAVASYFSQNIFNNYPIEKIENTLKLFNAIPFNNFKPKTLVEYLTKILEGVKQEHSDIELYPHNNFKSTYSIQSEVKENYLSKRFLADLNDFTTQNEKKLESTIGVLDNLFLEKLPNSVYEYLKNIHKNEEWLNFKISVENFDDYGYFTNMYVHGFSSKDISIRDLFPMQEIKNVIEKHKKFDSSFLNFFFKDNFFYQLFCPLLGWLLKEFSELLDTKLSVVSTDGYDAGSVIKDFYLMTPSGVNIKTGHYDEIKFCDFSDKSGIMSRFLDTNTQFQLGFEHFMGLSKFGNQSFLNSWSSLSSFLLSSALYFAIFKNSNYIDFYDKKIQYYLENFSSLKFKDVLNFYEAVSINEINANQQNFMGKNTLNTPLVSESIKLNTLMYNAMYLMSDLILPNIPYTRYNRDKPFITNHVIDMTLNGKIPLHFRLDIPFQIVQSHNEDVKDLINSSNNPSLYYSMTQRFMRDVEWIITKNEWEKNSRPYLLTNNTTIIKLVVFNSVKMKDDSGSLSYFNIINSI